MKKACQTQCPDCPFRSSSIPGWLGAYGDPGAVYSTLWKGDAFFCHTRTDYERPDWQARAERNGQLCLGALLFVHDAEMPQPNDPEVRAAMAVAVAKREADPEAFAVMSPRDFRDHHYKDRMAWVEEQIAAGNPHPLKGLLSGRR